MRVTEVNEDEEEEEVKETPSSSASATSPSPSTSTLATDPIPIDLRKPFFQFHTTKPPSCLYGDMCPFKHLWAYTQNLIILSTLLFV
jgi:hypothetical protein